MNIIFFGSSDFAIPSLRAILASGHKISALVTQPDRKRGRHLKVSSPPTKVLAVSQNIPIYQPADASSPESIEYLRNLKADIFVVVSFGQILRKGLLDAPKLCSINLHGSLLPKYRGAAPINRAIMAGERRTGATVMRMNEKMDAGDIILKKALDIGEDDTAITVGEAVSEMGSGLLLEAIDLVETGKARFERQDESAATYAPKLKKADGLIDWNLAASEIRDRVRGLLPWPGAYTRYRGKILKVLRARICDLPSDGGYLQPGEVADIRDDKAIVVKTSSGGLAITHLQLEGKKPLDAASFLRGHGMEKGESFN
jgi:methionyl-tRNA formyltransferase